MADDIDINDRTSTSKTIRADDVGGKLIQIIKLALGGDGVEVVLSANAGAADAGTIRFTQASDDAAAVLAGGAGATISNTIIRPSNTIAYSANDALSSSTTGPANNVLTGAARVSGGSGIITDVLVTCNVDAATPLQGEIWIFDQAPTAINDNAAFSIIDGDILNLVGVIPFTLASPSGSAGSGPNAYDHIAAVNIGFTCVGSANLYYLVKVTSAYTPTSAETLTLRAKVIRTS